MPEPINTNNPSNPCTDPQSSSCVIYPLKPPDCYNLCGVVTITDIEYQNMLRICALMNSIDLSALDLKCLCGTGLLQCCPEGWDLVQITDGAYACQNRVSKIISTRELIPCPSTPCPEKTLVNVLQLMVNKLCP